MAYAERECAPADWPDDGREIGIRGDVTDADGSLVARPDSVCVTLRGEEATNR